MLQKVRAHYSEYQETERRLPSAFEGILRGDGSGGVLVYSHGNKEVGISHLAKVVAVVHHSLEYALHFGKGSPAAVAMTDAAVV